MERANFAFHQRVQQGYQELAQTHPQRIVRIDAGGTPEAVQQQVCQVISQRFAEWNYPLLPH
jgi:dTMP kinase